MRGIKQRGGKRPMISGRVPRPPPSLILVLLSRLSQITTGLIIMIAGEVHPLCTETHPILDPVMPKGSK